MYHLPKNMINTVTALIFITSPFHWQISPGFPDQTLYGGVGSQGSRRFFPLPGSQIKISIRPIQKSMIFYMQLWAVSD